MSPRSRTGRGRCLLRAAGVAVVASTALGLGGCAGEKPKAAPLNDPLTLGGAAPVVIDAQTYAAAFDAAIEVVRDAGMVVERVDARRGVISTRPTPSGGLLTPWTAQYGGVREALDDAVLHRRRAARISFAPQSMPDGVGVWGSVADSGEPITISVAVVIEELNRPGRRIGRGSVRLTTRAQDPQLVERGMQPMYVVREQQDPVFAATLLERIRDRIAVDQPAAKDAKEAKDAG